MADRGNLPSALNDATAIPDSNGCGARVCEEWGRRITARWRTGVGVASALAQLPYRISMSGLCELVSRRRTQGFRCFHLHGHDGAATRRRLTRPEAPPDPW